MTVLMREELNDADLAWASVDTAWPPAQGPAMRVEDWCTTPAPRERRVVEPEVLRALGAL
jgi:hypothetical protein